jgi:glyoxylase-like metal-dependent hydrolase (beta-lactamase superfamily II)
MMRPICSSVAAGSSAAEPVNPVNMSRVALGDFEITLVRAGFYWWDGGAMFGVVPKTLWSRRFAADELNRVRLGFNCYVVRTGDHCILIETGAGDKPDQGIDPESIDIIINSHLHFDHCGGNTFLLKGVAQPAFPRARFYTRRGEWEHAHERHVRDRVSYIDANYDPLLENGQMHLLDADFEVAPGIEMKLAPGHNRDMMVVTASSRGQTFCFFSDLIPTAAHVPPSWVAAFDLFPLEAIDNKTRWLNQAVDGQWICAFAHEPDLAFARINKTDQSFTAAPCAAAADGHAQAPVLL